MRLVPIEQLAEVWPDVLPWIRQAVQEGQGDENELDVLISIAAGRYLLWYEPGKFAAVAQLVSFPRQRVATVVYLGGTDLDAIKHGWAEGLDWAKAQGINVVRTWGREGWEKLLGLKRTGVILQAELI